MFFNNNSEGLFTLTLKKQAKVVTIKIVIEIMPTIKFLKIIISSVQINTFFEVFSKKYPIIDEKVCLIITKLPLASKLLLNTEIIIDRSEQNAKIDNILKLI